MIIENELSHLTDLDIVLINRTQKLFYLKKISDTEVDVVKIDKGTSNSKFVMLNWIGAIKNDIDNYPQDYQERFPHIIRKYKINKIINANKNKI